MRRSRIQSVGCGKEKECSEDKENRRIYGVVAFVAFSCYFNGLHGDLVHDDIPAVKQNKDVLGISPLFDVFKNDFWGTSMGDPLSHKSYRPLTVFTFRANYWLFGLQPFWYHVCNVALHAIASLLFTRVCLAVAGLKPKFAGMAGALFAAHPIHTEAVTGIVGRADVLACVFFLLSFLAYHGQTSPDGSEPGHISGLSVWLSVLLGGLSMLAKETGITVMGVNLAYDLYRCWPYIKRTIVEIRWNEETLHFSRRAAKVLISLCLLLVFRLALLQGSLPRFSSQDNPTAFHPCRHVRFLTFCYLAAFNCWLLLCPSTLSHDWQMGSVPLVTSLGDSRNVATCIFFLTFILLAYKGIADFEQQRHPPLLLGCLFLVLPFLPAANLIVTVGFVVAERVLFIPSLGFVLLVVYGVQLMWSAFLRQRSLLLCAGLLLLLFFCSRTIVRNRDWTTRDSLIRAGLKSLPHNAKMHYNFANYLRDSGNFDQAVKHYKEALRLWPSYASAHNNLGTLMSETEEAEGHFLAAIRHSPNHVNAHYNLGQVYRKVNRTEDAVRMLNRCILLDTSYAPAYLLLVKLYTSLGREKAVGKLLKRLTVLEPENPDNLAEYGSWLYRSGRSWEALNYFRKALASSSNHKSSLLGIANILRSKGHHVQAQLIMRRAYFLSKEHRTISYDVDIYIRNGKLENIMYDRQEPAQSLPKQQHTFGRPPCGQMARQSHQHKQMKKKKKKSSDSRAMHLVNKTTAAREACTLAAASCVTGLSPHVDIAGHSTGTAAFNQGYHYSFWNHQQMALPDDPLLVPESPTRSSGELDVLCMGSFQDEEFSQELMTG